MWVFKIRAVTLNSFQGLFCIKDADPENSGQHDDRVKKSYKN
ncbi:hypothetical protein QF042_004070 [Pedobacter sp. W3I1]|nr:hypothetical protein [Pedobacter sp. W3I1]